MARAPKKPAAGKSKGGRPPTYDPKKHPELYRAHRVAGKTVREIAAAMRIHVDTLYDWRDKHPEFSEQMAAAEIEKTEVVANSVYNRARGYNYKTAHVEFDSEGKIVKRIRKTAHVPSETSAATLFLTNRDKDNWKQKQVLEHDVSESLAERLDRATARHKAERGED